jgi:hypothetical protein
MARIGRDPNTTKNELQAGESGAQAVGQAAGQLSQAQQAGQENALKSASVFGGLTQEGQKIDIESQRRKDEAKFHEQEAANQEDRNSIEAASQGVQPQGPTRAQQLRQEMERGRQQAQMDKPLEISGPDQKTYAKTPEQSKIDEDKSFSNRLNAQANFLRASESFNKAQMVGDKDAAKRERESLMQPIKSGASLFNAARKGDMTDGQWDNLKQLAADSPDPALRAEIDKKQFGPRTSDFIQRRINFDALKFMAATGDMPDGHLVDMASPMMGQFTQTANQMQSFLKNIDSMTGGAMSQVYKIDSLAKRNNVVRQLSADAMLKQLANPGATTPGSMPTPSSGQPQQQGSADVGLQPTKPKLGESIYDANGQRKPAAGIGQSIKDSPDGSYHGYRSDKQRAGAPRPGLK